MPICTPISAISPRAMPRRKHAAAARRRLRGERALFQNRYEKHIAREAAKLDDHLRRGSEDTWRAMSALALSDFALVTCLGAGRAETLAALRAGRSGLAPCQFDTLPLDAYAGEVPGLDALPLNRRMGGVRLPQQPARRPGAGAGWFHGHRGGGASPLRRRTHRRVSRHQHLGHIADGNRLSPPRCRMAHLPPGFDYARTHNTYALGAFRARLSRPRRARPSSSPPPVPPPRKSSPAPRA